MLEASAKVKAAAGSARIVRGRLGLPRRFTSHLSRAGRRYREHYEALLEQLGPFSTELQRQAAADVAQWHVVKLAAVEAWEREVTARRTGKGRRPSTSDVIRLSKRVAMESQSYAFAFGRLRELLGTVPRSAHDDVTAPYRNGGAA